MGADHILWAAVMLAIPMSMKYLLAFEMRKKVAVLKTRQRQVEAMANRLAALEREQEVVHGALVQVEDQRRWAQTRRGMIEQEVRRISSRPRIAPEPTYVLEEDAAPSLPLPAAAEAVV